MSDNNAVWSLLQELGNKQGISEIIINNVDNVYIERAGELIRLNVRLPADHIMHFCHDVAKFNKQKFDKHHQVLDGTLQDGSRINIIGNEYTQSSPAITIRKYLKFFTTLNEGAKKFGVPPKLTQFLKALVCARQNVLISGGTGSGKTTLLNMLIQEISPIERIITIEDTRELSFKLPNVVRLTSKIKTTENQELNILTMRDLVKNTLRMRPNRIIIGEVRGAEVFDLLQSMNTGHDGSMCTIHSNSPAECYQRLETLFMLSGHEVPIKAIRKQIATALDFIIQLDRTRDGQRVISAIAEVSGMEGDSLLHQDIVRYDEEQGVHFTGLVPARVQKLMDYGLDTDFFIDI